MKMKAPLNERFRISIEVDVADLGPAMVHLAAFEGLTVTGSELITDVATYKKREYSDHAIKGEDFLRTWIADHPTFRAKKAIEAFRADGRTDGAGYTALRVLVEKGELKKLGEGNYSRTDVKPLAAPRGTFDKPGWQVIVSFAKKNHGRFTSTKITELFSAEGRARNSVSTSVDRLMKDGTIKRVGEGVYALADQKKPEKKKSKKPSKKVEKKLDKTVNGTGAEVVANG